MKKYYISYENLIVNCLIEINKKTGRRIIDMQDIYVYDEKIKKSSKKNNIDLTISYEMNGLDKEFKTFISLEHNPKPIYVMLPWIDSKDLIFNFRGYIPFDILCVLIDNESNITTTKKEIRRIKQLEMLEKKSNLKQLKEINNKIKEYNELIQIENNKIIKSNNIKFKQKTK